jgi:hypothetical protein
MVTREKTPEEVIQDLAEQEERLSGPVAIYRIDVEKLSQYSYKAIADRLNEMFGVIAIDLDDEGIAEKMFLDGPLGPFLTRDDEKVDIHEEAMEGLQES